ncbi:hypothetical protein PIB30_005854 [Stylosanthes scabra]|uniref:Uncharacterized protein n=1 Tax=Stylosanthes scabra TaxID=79078 RepID=A0ABU6Z3B6_9FABA|nr:hypothetical protein [Stylosanthes scabra]
MHLHVLVVEGPNIGIFSNEDLYQNAILCSNIGTRTAISNYGDQVRLHQYADGVMENKVEDALKAAGVGLGFLWVGEGFRPHYDMVDKSKAPVQPPFELSSNDSEIPETRIQKKRILGHRTRTTKHSILVPARLALLPSSIMNMM